VCASISFLLIDVFRSTKIYPLSAAGIPRSDAADDAQAAERLNSRAFDESSGRDELLELVDRRLVVDLARRHRRDARRIRGDQLGANHVDLALVS
jgi:hypothetical protein